MPKPTRRRRRRRARYWWEELRTNELLDVRIRDLELRMEGTALESRVAALNRELERAGMRFKPYVYLSTDWFTPEGSTGFAVPFFLAHPRLVRLEHAMMYEAEGGDREWCMKLLRHETGHALDNAYRLHRRKSWRDTFGNYTAPYRQVYAPRPNSREFVQNLDYWYAQSHPAEDYAESFAVWLRFGPRFRKRYAEWPRALAKLEYLDGLMREIARRPAPVRTRDRPDSLPRLKLTLREYYYGRRAGYDPRQPWVYDRYLRHLFAEPADARRRDKAAGFLRRSRTELRSRVSAMTGYPRYLVDQALRMMISRCRELDLRLSRSRHDTKMGAGVLLTVLAMNFKRGAKPRYRR